MRLRRVTTPARVEMTPLMDVVFLLLVFFVFAMTVMAVHRGMRLNLPASETAIVEHTTAVALYVKTDGSLFMDETPVSVEDLPQILRQRTLAATTAHEELTVQVFAEDTLSYQSLFRILDTVKASGVKAISLQARAAAPGSGASAQPGTAQ